MDVITRLCGRLACHPGCPICTLVHVWNTTNYSYTFMVSIAVPIRYPSATLTSAAADPIATPVADYMSPGVSPVSSPALPIPSPAP